MALARDLAAVTGESLDEAVVRALDDRLRCEREQAHILAEIEAIVTAADLRDLRDDDAFLYDENGLPRSDLGQRVPPMVIDTSALVAIAMNESDHTRFSKAILTAHTRRLSSGTWLEAGIVLDRRSATGMSATLDQLISRLAILVEPVTLDQARLARAAHRRCEMPVSVPIFENTRVHSARFSGGKNNA